MSRQHCWMFEREPNISQHSSTENVITKIKICKCIQQKVEHNTYLTKWLHSHINNNHMGGKNEYTVTALSFQAQWRGQGMEHHKLEYIFHIAALMAAIAYS